LAPVGVCVSALSNFRTTVTFSLSPQSERGSATAAEAERLAEMASAAAARRTNIGRLLETAGCVSSSELIYDLPPLAPDCSRGGDGLGVWGFHSLAIDPCDPAGSRD